MGIPDGYIELDRVLYGRFGHYPFLTRADIKRTIWRKLSRYARFRTELVSLAELERAKNVARIEAEIEALVG
ncbi:hypothetical protein [Enhydrobacter sp.]|jgi:hypothetical protein|uniref:hypothetical protein n=1 Tax=Enhydrobacter sp. TaxID=1894999 RepID=UPI002611D0DE|nr:hypothetical protein [Enhydrobacter sp.]WIM10599.1 MAG: hypothetical protein OJF58_001555 [Enhydrobacter sp.]